MKYKTIVGGVNVETDDLSAFTRAIIRLAGKPSGQDKTVTRKQHKKHMHRKVCPKCSRVCAGKLGLGVHMAKCNVKPVDGVVRRIPVQDLPF